MFSWGSKYLSAMTVVALLTAIVYGLVTGGELIGVISAGYKGGVGEHTGYTVLAVLTFMLAGLTVFDIMMRDGDAEEASARLGTEQILTVSTPRAPSYWGPLAAFGLACLALGAAVSVAFLILGIVVLVIVGLEWVVLAWSDRATGDPAINAALRSRVLGPIETPLLSLLAVAVVVTGVSRVLLAVSEAGSVAVASLVALVIFGSAIAIVKTNASRSVISAIVSVGAIAVVAGGIIGAAVGQREIHHESGDDADHSVVEGEGE